MKEHESWHRFTMTQRVWHDDRAGVVRVVQGGPFRGWGRDGGWNWGLIVKPIVCCFSEIWFHFQMLAVLTYPDLWWYDDRKHFLLRTFYKHQGSKCLKNTNKQSQSQNEWQMIEFKKKKLHALYSLHPNNLKRKLGTYRSSNIWAIWDKSSRGWNVLVHMKNNVLCLCL